MGDPELPNSFRGLVQKRLGCASGLHIKYWRSAKLVYKNNWVRRHYMAAAAATAVYTCSPFLPCDDLLRILLYAQLTATAPHTMTHTHVRTYTTTHCRCTGHSLSSVSASKYIKAIKQSGAVVNGIDRLVGVYAKLCSSAGCLSKVYKGGLCSKHGGRGQCQHKEYDLAAREKNHYVKHKLPS